MQFNKCILRYHFKFYEMKKTKNYQQSITTKASKPKAYNALVKHIPDWWSTIDGTSDKVGDEFKVSFGTESYWTFKVVSLYEHNEVVWECIESHQDHNLKGIDEEWLNTKLYWSISESSGITKIDFLHDGLLSTGVCYDVCSNGWDFYILDSLKNYLDNGKGKPSAK